MRLLKVVRKDLTAPFQTGFQYEIGKKEICSDFDDSDKKCSRGFYATDIEGLIYTFRHKRGDRVFECEVGGKSKEFDQFKRRYEEFTLLDKEYSYNELIVMAKEEEERLGYKLSEVLFPINPFNLPKRDVTKQDIELLKKCASVYDSVCNSVNASVYDSVNDSVYDSVCNSIYASVYDSVWMSIRDSACNDSTPIYYTLCNSINTVYSFIPFPTHPYIGSIFSNIEKWKYIDHEPNIYPFQCYVDLWKSGKVPSFDGKIWRLHSGKNADIVYEMKI